MAKKLKKTMKKNDRPRTNYPIGDFLIRLKNAARAGNNQFVAVNTKLIREVSKVLVESNVLESFEEDGSFLNVNLKVHKKKPLIMDLKLVSKPGLRIYKKKEELERRKGPSFLILTTNKGVMTDKQAIEKNLGGEVIAEIL